MALQQVYLIRHGETAWSLTGQHTGRTDLPLTDRGERNARRLAKRLKNLSIAVILTSPLQRAARTCELAGFMARATIEPNLVEWDYGEYEGLRSTEIRARRPDWDLFRDGCPGGESAPQVGARTDAVIQRIRAVDENVLVFSSGHLLSVFAARWLGLDASAGRYFHLDTASVSNVTFERARAETTIRLWNDTHHTET
jgi:broad specificity phosphatase PhoE